MRGTKGEQGKKEKERTKHMENILSQILDELKDLKEEMHDVKAEVRETKQEIREMKEENRKEHAEMKEENRKEHVQMKKDITEMKEENRKEHVQMKKDITEMKEENRKEHIQMKKEIKEATDFIIDTTKSIARITTDIRNEQQKQIRQLMLMENVNFEKNKLQDEMLAKHHARIKGMKKIL